MKKVKKITSKTTLTKILENPEANAILAKYNIPCLFCPMAVIEAESLTIGQISETYGLDLKNLLKDLNKKRKAEINNN